jgi:Cdc6-like AAA superfamily ATPase
MLVPVGEIKTDYYGEGRKLETQEFECILQTLRTFGQTVVLVIDQDDQLVAGYKMLKALRHEQEPEAACLQLTLTRSDRELLNILLNYTKENYDQIDMSERLKIVLEKYTIAQIHTFINMPAHDLRDIEKLLDWSPENYKPKAKTQQLGLEL